MDPGKYSALHQSHAQTQKAIDAHEAGKELTARRVDKLNRERVRSSDAKEPDKSTPSTARTDPSSQLPSGQHAATSAAPPTRPEAPTPGMAVLDGPAPYETAVHFSWRVATAARIARENAKDAERKAKALGRGVGEEVGLNPPPGWLKVQHKSQNVQKAAHVPGQIDGKAAKESSPTEPEPET
jgi:hypothetical protein